MHEPQGAFGPSPEIVGGMRADLPPGDLDSIAVTFNRYALATDTADGEILRSTLLPEAVLAGSVGTGPQSLEVHGSTEIVEYVVKTRQGHGYTERHFITNLSAHPLSAHSARAHAYFLVARIGGSTVVNSATGRYQADLVRGEDEVWRFGRIDILMDIALQ